MRDHEHDPEVGGLPIARGTSLLLCPLATHRLPELWPETERFDPSLGLGKARNSAYMTFKTGRRICIGNHLVMTAAAIVPAMLA